MGQCTSFEYKFIFVAIVDLTVRIRLEFLASYLWISFWKIVGYILYSYWKLNSTRFCSLIIPDTFFLINKVIQNYSFYIWITEEIVCATHNWKTRPRDYVHCLFVPIQATHLTQNQPSSLRLPKIWKYIISIW